MLSRFFADQAASELGAVERDYLGDVEVALRGVPRRRRRELLAVAAEHLTERPAARDRQELWDALGRPSAYAEELATLAGGGDTDDTGPLRRRRRVMVGTILGAGVTIVAVAIVAMRAWGSAAPPPDLVSHCAGTRTDPAISLMDEFGRDWVQWQREGRFGIELCFSGPSDVTLLGLGYDEPAPGDGTWFRFAPDGIELRDDRLATTGRFAADEPLEVPLGPATANVTVWFAMTTNCGSWSADATIGIGSVPLRVRHDGDVSTVWVDLDRPVVVGGVDPTDCRP